MRLAANATLMFGKGFAILTQGQPYLARISELRMDIKILLLEQPRYVCGANLNSANSASPEVSLVCAECANELGIS